MKQIIYFLEFFLYDTINKEDIFTKKTASPICQSKRGFKPLLQKSYMFGTNSICYQRPKAGYET